MVMRMHQWESHEHSAGATIMNAISQAASNSMTARLPIASAPSALPAQRGGFASTLAVVQVVPTSSESTTNAGKSPSALATATTATTDRGVAVTVPQAPQPKKAQNNSSPLINNVAANWPPPAPDPTLNPIPVSDVMQSAFASGGIQSDFSFATSVIPQSTLFGFSAATVGLAGDGIANQTNVQGQGSQTETVTGQLAVAAATPTNIVTPNPITPDIPLANAGAANVTPANTISPSMVTANLPLNNDSPGSVGNRNQVSGPASLTNFPSTAAPQPPQSESMATASGTPGAFVNSVAPTNLTGVVIQNQIAGQSSTQQLGMPAGTSAAQLIPQGGHQIETTTPTAIRAANLANDGKPVPEVLLALAAGPQTAAADSVSATNTGITQANLSALQNGSAPAQSTNQQSAAPSDANLSPAIAWGAASLPSASSAPTPAIANRAVPTGYIAGAPGSILSSTLPATDSSNGSASASQTPFSVFFSGPGPGTEAAASTLPKMILPGSSSSLADTRTSFNGPAGASSQNNSTSTSGVQSNGVPGVSAQNTASQHNGGSQPGTSPLASTLHHPGDASAESLPPASVPASAPAIPTIPAAASLSMVGQPPPAAELSKASSPPASAPERPLSTIPSPPEPATAGLGPVQVAQMVTRVGQSEMRIGMNTSAFGSVEVRTVIHASDVGLIIGSEKGDLRTLLANDLPAITNTLQQQNLKLNSVNFMQGFAFSNNSSGGGDPQQQRSFIPMRLSADYGLPEVMSSDTVGTPSAGGFGGEQSSLSILA